MCLGASTFQILFQKLFRTDFLKKITSKAVINLSTEPLLPNDYPIQRNRVEQGHILSQHSWIRVDSYLLRSGSLRIIILSFRLHDYILPIWLFQPSHELFGPFPPRLHLKHGV